MMKVMKYILLIVAAGLLVSGFLVLRSQTNVQQPAPAASTTEQSPQEETAPKANVVIQNYTFMPSTINARPGEMITITNQDSLGHTFTSDSNMFDTGTIAPGQTVTVAAPSTPGSYPFHCSPHPYMTGTLLVE